MITSEYCSFSFSASFIAKFLMKRPHPRPMPPFVPNTSELDFEIKINGDNPNGKQLNEGKDDFVHIGLIRLSSVVKAANYLWEM